MEFIPPVPPPPPPPQVANKADAEKRANTAAAQTINSFFMARLYLLITMTVSGDKILTILGAKPNAAELCLP
jgi:hypothetical protein